MGSEIHVLNDDHAERGAAGEDSLAALRGTAERLYVQIVLGQNNHRLPPPWGLRRFGRYLRWAWLIEGGAQYFAGQAPLFRAAVIRRLREGGQPAFPPSARDAIILGGTVFDLLEGARGPEACERMVARLHREQAKRWLGEPRRRGLVSRRAPRFGDQRPGCLVRRLWHEDVPRPRGEEVGDVEPAGAALDARDPLLEQDPLDELSLGEVSSPGG